MSERGEGENGRETGGWQRATLFVRLMSQQLSGQPSLWRAFSELYPEYRTVCNGCNHFLSHQI